MKNQSTKNQSTWVAQAAQHYRQGDFEQALHCYQQAADKYGQHLFKANLQLCQQKLDGRNTSASIPMLPNSENNIALQLKHTQQLLEHYYNRTQELEYQLLDR
ncbi:hypothetical protein [Zobellella iuensis]|uniref:Tetratricopeptide repeat protein n=1 Tax=Zobellella iuensis TaxID=2803811 RepID=A0ABS1QSA4_9GAMM|nr:hypothetical protein [Zobellella iuensis]MBL1377755.1 hypothetical protein [Zobellella iuensis]